MNHSIHSSACLSSQGATESLNNAVLFKGSENNMFIVRSCIPVAYIEGVKIFIKYCIFIVSIEEMKICKTAGGTGLIPGEGTKIPHSMLPKRKDTYLL